MERNCIGGRVRVEEEEVWKMTMPRVYDTLDEMFSWSLLLCAMSINANMNKNQHDWMVDM